MNTQPSGGPSTSTKKSIFRNSYGDINGGAVAGAIATVVVAIIILLVIITGFYQVVEPAHKGIVIKGGELQEEVLDNGFYLKLPFWTDIVGVYTGNLSTDGDEDGEFKEENPFRNIQPLSKDGQVLDIDAQINYSIVNPKLFREKTDSTDPRIIEQLVFIPTLRRLVYDYASEYTWKGLIQEGDRQEFGERIFRAMATGETTKRECKEEYTEIDATTGTEIIVEAGCQLIETERLAPLSDYGISISAVNFKKIKPNIRIIEAVEEAQAKEQEVKIAAQQAEIAKQRANEAIEKRRGETESFKLTAEAEAFKIRVSLEEEAKGVIALAEAERKRALALAASQQLVEYKKLEILMRQADALVEFGKNWSGDVPSELTVIGTEEAKGLNMFLGMTSAVANPGQ